MSVRAYISSNFVYREGALVRIKAGENSKTRGSEGKFFALDKLDKIFANHSHIVYGRQVFVNCQKLIESNNGKIEESGEAYPCKIGIE